MTDESGDKMEQFSLIHSNFGYKNKKKTLDKVQKNMQLNQMQIWIQNNETHLRKLKQRRQRKKFKK